jgi:TrmH family RNA methyltransferase
MSSAIRIVLVDASHPGNIGASARAMKNMGLDSLVLVRPHSYPDPEATARASGAADVLAQARVVGTVDEAIGDCGLVVGTTARARSANWRVVDSRGGAGELAVAADSRPAAVLFGGERNGLANEDLARCQALMRIPSAAGYESLNLAQAVQIICYEVMLATRCRAIGPAGSPTPRATADEMLALNAHLERVMRATGFMHDGNAGQLGERVQRLVARALPDDGEVRILRGWLAAIERRLRSGG